jgi:hypothetical protein
MSKENKVEELKTKRFVIRKSLVGKNVVISFTNKKQELVSYNHDEVYNYTKIDLKQWSVLLNISLILIVMQFQHSVET